jgi:NDP-sugar pyrophosphorylase family protein
MKTEKLSKYKAVILAGGKGTRLYPITLETPKPLLCINKKPIINYQVDLFLSQGIKDIAVLINKEFRQDFEWWKKRYFPKKNIIFVEEKTPLGTFGGLWLLKKWLQDSSFFVSNGDELKKINLAKMISLHEKKRPIGTIALVKVKNPQEYGVAICNSNIIKKFVEKPKNPPSNYINSGLYLFSPEIFDYHSKPKFLMVEKDIFPVLAKEKRLLGIKFRTQWFDCGTWQRYAEAIKLIKNSR